MTMDFEASRRLEDELQDLEAMFIAETFHTSQPIRSKPLQTIISRVWIKDKPKKIKAPNGTSIKQEPQPRTTINDRFSQLMALRAQACVHFEEEEDEEDDDQFDDIDDEDTTTEELLLGSTKGMKRSTKTNIAVNLAKKLKKRAIANRLGVAYNPGRRLKGLGSKKSANTTKSWSEKFGRLLAAKKLLYLPLLFHKYKMGPKRTREELDYEIDLYMSEVKNAKKMKLGFDQIKDAVNGVDDNHNNGLKVINSKDVLSSFGGPGWRKRLKKVKEEVVPVKEELDMEIDQYMANKDSRTIKMNGMDGSGDHSMTPAKEALDSDLDQYMAIKESRTSNKLSHIIL